MTLKNAACTKEDKNGIIHHFEKLGLGWWEDEKRNLMKPLLDTTIFLCEQISHIILLSTSIFLVLAVGPQAAPLLATATSQNFTFKKHFTVNHLALNTNPNPCCKP